MPLLQHNENYVVIKKRLLMKILKSVYDSILRNSLNPPPESGGILGGSNFMITCYIPDIHNTGNGYDIYIPNVEFLNRTITDWKTKGITFYGMYHTHFPKGNELSNGDKEYIHQIMRANQHTKLYFPIVIPNQKMVCYCAEILDSQLVISRQAIKIINENRRNKK